MPPSPPRPAKAAAAATSKWKILVSAVKNDRSCRSFCFPSYQLFEVRQDEDNEEEDEENASRRWFVVTANGYADLSIKVCVPRRSFSCEELIGFNNTGNVRIWPSEECLSAFCLENPSLFAGKAVLELGCGMTGLAGLVAARSAKRVLLTDGNEASVENVKAMLERNSFTTSSSLSCRILKWSDDEADVGTFDAILCADCLFFDEGRPQLIGCLKATLADGGVAYVVAPQRHGTLDDFLRQVELDGTFDHKSSRCYSAKVAEVGKQLEKDERFDASLHYPIMVELRRRKL